MTSTLSTVPATETGIVCGKCSTFAVKVRHASLTAVRLCCATVKVQTTDGYGTPHIVRVPVSGTLAENIVKITTLPPVPGAPAPATIAEVIASDYQGLLDTPAQSNAVCSQTPEEVPAGRYAIRGTDGVIKFYKIDHGRIGSEWEGRVFVSAMASDELHQVRNRATRLGILAGILVDVDGARLLAARELKRCMRCNRTLTDETSRAAGMGPECRSK